MKYAWLLCLCLSGCIQFTPVDPGAEAVVVASSDAAARDAKLIDSTSGQMGTHRLPELPALAKNYTHAMGGNLAIVRTTQSDHLVTYTIEAYRR